MGDGCGGNVCSWGLSECPLPHTPALSFFRGRLLFGPRKACPASGLLSFSARLRLGERTGLAAAEGPGAAAAILRSRGGASWSCPRYCRLLALVLGPRRPTGVVWGGRGWVVTLESALWSVLEMGALRLALVRSTPSTAVRSGGMREEASSGATVLGRGSERHLLSRPAPSACLRGRSGWSPSPSPLRGCCYLPFCPVCWSLARTSRAREAEKSMKSCSCNLPGCVCWDPSARGRAGKLCVSSRIDSRRLIVYISLVLRYISAYLPGRAELVFVSSCLALEFSSFAAKSSVFVASAFTSVVSQQISGKAGEMSLSSGAALIYFATIPVITYLTLMILDILGFFGSFALQYVGFFREEN